MNNLSHFSTRRKILISILSGILSLLLSPYGIGINLGEVIINLPWAIFLPILTAMAFGWQYALVAGLSGGAFFPLLLWANNGWANIGTSLMYLGFYALIGLTNDKFFLKKIKRLQLRIFFALTFCISIIYLYYIIFFNLVLTLNPAFWEADTINNLPIETLYGFAFKDSINLIIIALLSETLLKLNFVRKLFGIQLKPEFKSNHLIFAATISLSIIVCLIFVGLGFSLLEGDKALQTEHISLAFFVIISSGFLVSRMLFNFSENQYYIQNNLNRSEDKFRTLFENSKDAIVIIKDGIYFECNPITLKIFGCSLTEFTGKTPYYFSPLYQPDGTISSEKGAKLMSLAFQGESQWFEWQHTRLDGTNFDAEISLS